MPFAVRALRIRLPIVNASSSSTSTVSAFVIVSVCHIPSRSQKNRQNSAPIWSEEVLECEEGGAKTSHTRRRTMSTHRPGDQTQTAAELENEWKTDARWNGVNRDYSAEDVIALRGSVREDRTLARRGAENLWRYFDEEPFVNALGALTGNQAVQQVRAGLKAIYLSGWQVAADANTSGQTYPDQSLYPVNSVPAVVRRINNALLRADQIEFTEGGEVRDWVQPIVADAEAGFGGPLNAYELMSAMIDAGAAGVHWEDQLASEKKCGHLGGKVL